MGTISTTRVRLSIASFIASVLLAACGGDGGSEPEEATGMLHGGRISGVSYETPTRQGQTDVNGRFRYLPGEMVTFSVGATGLGAARGAPEVTLFTLAGLTPPTTERTLRRELDRARRVNTPFTRATNIMRLLISLDSDGNPANGLDVRDRAGQLAMASLDLDLGLLQFDDRLHRAAPSLVRNVPLWKPVAQLYSSIGLRVRVHGQVRAESESLYGFFPETHITTYTADGALETESSDHSGDGVADSTYRYAYDAMHRTVDTRGDRDFDFNGTIDDRYRMRREFDGAGNETASENTAESSVWPQSNYRYLTGWQYDAGGHAVGGTMLIDSDANGSFDQRRIFEAVYDARGNGRSYRWRDDTNLDGVVDSVATGVYEYDAQNRRTHSIEEVDGGADGDIDQRITVVAEYGSPRGATRQVQTFDLDGDGVADSRTTYSWTYDAAGNRATSRTEEDADGDGIVDSTFDYTFTFNRDRKLLTETRLDDQDGDGIAEQRSFSSNEIDDIGNVPVSTFDYDDGNDGTVDYTSMTVTEHGADGEALATVSRTDANMDGFTDYRTQTTYTYELRDDGALLLAQWYLTRFEGYDLGVN